MKPLKVFMGATHRLHDVPVGRRNRDGFRVAVAALSKAAAKRLLGPDVWDIVQTGNLEIQALASASPGMVFYQPRARSATLDSTKQPLPGSRRWRQVQIVDEAWQLEVADPEYLPARIPQEMGDNHPGWRPVATVWHVGAPFGWRFITMPAAPETPRFDHATLDAAKQWAEAVCPRSSSTHTTKEAPSGR